LNRIVYRYPIRVSSHPQEVEVPRPARVVHVDLAKDPSDLYSLNVWIEHPVSGPNVPRAKIHIYVHGTGHIIEDPQAEHAGSFVNRGTRTPLVWHVYTRMEWLA